MNSLLSKENNIVDIQDLFQRYSLESICTIAFGLDIGCIEGDVSFAKDWDASNEYIGNRFISPVWRFYKTKSEYQLEDAVKRIDTFCYNVISQRRKELDQGQSERDDLLTKYILYKDPETNETYSDDYLRDILTNLLLAGRDTVSQLLTWCIYLLYKNPDVGIKLLQEIESTGGNLDYDNIKNMKYLRGVLNETLRFIF